MNVTKTDSGLYIPVPTPTLEELQAKRRRQIKDYYEAHQCCPRCGGTSITSTCMGYWHTADGVEDHNHANCNDRDCKWHGIVDEMTPQRINTPTSKGSQE